ncbi:hypothetical protein LSTR_LSTR004005 [Laodelphax striatellus]|uniref:Uncharacterized protein n=1 Tax=Laodelphax striatellus TaxID=195883 RepID=A0A482WFT3_LAOST|nr:hypothetical protein LSTR_LSTR004005 [Laodelphax striatellus]
MLRYNIIKEYHAYADKLTQFKSRKHPIRLLCQLLFFLVRSTFRCVLGWGGGVRGVLNKRDEISSQPDTLPVDATLPPTATIIAYFMSGWNDAEFGRRKSSSKALSTSPLPSKASSVAAAALPSKSTLANVNPSASRLPLQQ